MNRLLALLVAGCLALAFSGVVRAADDNPLDKKPADKAADEPKKADDAKPAAKPTTPEEMLKSKGLSKVGILYVLEGDAKINEAMRQLRVAKKNYDDDNKKRLELEKQVKMAKAAISDWDYQYRALNEKLGQTQDAFQHNKIIGEINSLVSKMKEGIQYKDEREKDLAKLGSSRDAYVGAVLEVGDTVDKTQKEYEALAKDDDVKTAITQINDKAKPKVKLGPSPEFTQSLAFVKLQRGQVTSAIVKINSEGNVPHVDVTLNGKITRSMVLDSGASFVALTSDLAKSLGLVPGPNDVKIKLTLADGKVVEAHQMMLKNVRVGSFVVDNVECAVLPESLVAADNLLGGSFLRNFVYKLDPVAGELHMSQVGKPGDKPATPQK